MSGREAVLGVFSRRKGERLTFTDCRAPQGASFQLELFTLTVGLSATSALVERSTTDAFWGRTDEMVSQESMSTISRSALELEADSFKKMEASSGPEIILEP